MSDFLPFIVIGLVTGSVYGLAAVGLVLTYRTSGIFNFAHGTVAAIGAYVFYQLRDLNDLPWPVAFVVAVLVVGPLVGLAMEVLARNLANGSVVVRVVGVLGVLIAVQQIAIIRYGGATKEFAPFLPTHKLKILDVYIEVGQLIVMAVALLGTLGLSLMLRTTRLGRAMRGVVDNSSLVALTGTSPSQVRRLSWMIGCVFASLSGVLIAPSIGLDALILTLLVVQTFGAAAIGLFTSLPMTYVGGLVIGVGASLAQKYVADVTFVNLSGVPTSLPFLVLFAVLIFAPKRRLLDIAPDRQPPVRAGAGLPFPLLAGLAVAGVALLALVPTVVGARLIIYSLMLPMALVFLSLAFLERLSGQLSLAQLSFAAVGGTTMSHAVDAGIPFLLALVVAALVTVPVGALLAIPAIRLSGLYLALATLGFGLVLQKMVFGTSLMFGTGNSTAPVDRPSWASGDDAYYYLLLIIVVVTAVAVGGIRRSRLGRLLRAMADSPTALATNGMNTTVIKVIAFSISAGVAGLAGALIGPVTGQVSSNDYNIFASLLLVVVLALNGVFSDVPASFLSAIGIVVLPNYIADYSFAPYLNVLFGVLAVLVAVTQSRATTQTAARPGRGPADEQALRDRIQRRPTLSRLQETRA